MPGRHHEDVAFAIRVLDPFDRQRDLAVQHQRADVERVCMLARQRARGLLRALDVVEAVAPQDGLEMLVPHDRLPRRMLAPVRACKGVVAARNLAGGASAAGARAVAAGCVLGLPGRTVRSGDRSTGIAPRGVVFTIARSHRRRGGFDDHQTGESQNDPNHLWRGGDGDHAARRGLCWFLFCRARGSEPGSGRHHVGQSRLTCAAHNPGNA